MESLLPHYKDFVTSRGLKYHYYFSAPEEGKPSLLLVHGFPSLAVDWHNQIAYFKAKGYGLIVPDMLGYGGTDNPEDYKLYAHSLLAKDLAEIVEQEKVSNVFAIGHDWGSKTTSLLANLYQARFLGFGYVALGYLAPNTTMTYEQQGALLKQVLGYENFGYWSFFSAPDCNEILQKHSESFWSVVHTKQSGLAKYIVCPTGALRAFVESDTVLKTASYVTEEFARAHTEAFAKSGYQGPLNYYKVAVTGLDVEDAKTVPLENYTIQKPVFFAGAAQDVVCLPDLAKPTLAQFCPKATIKIFDAGHWVPLERPDELNAGLDEWISSVLA